jgi:hypothetical protein
MELRGFNKGFEYKVKGFRGWFNLVDAKGVNKRR